MGSSFFTFLEQELDSLQRKGLYKKETILTSAQKSYVNTKDQKLINLCANNYLGLSNHPEIVEAAIKTAEKYGFGLSSVRFICGTQDIHKQLETKIASFLQKEEALLYSSCFDANGGIFETLFTKEDAIFSDSLNHASLIDGIRLCKAQRFRFENNNLEDLEEKLLQAKGSRFRIIVTDGVFSMDGTIASLAEICQLAKKYDALVMIDDCHATGFLGEKGRGTHEYCKVVQEVDIISGTLGKALGGASGGFIAGKKEVIRMLRQRSRPYLFSNSLAPMIVGASLKALDLLEKNPSFRKTLWSNTSYFREQILSLGFTITSQNHPIIPILIGDAKVASQMAQKLKEQGVLAVSFSYPVVPENKARIRTQMSAAHTKEDLSKALYAFEKIKKEAPQPIGV